ncbi:MAG: response regulator [Acidobacteriota bacterium]
MIRVLLADDHTMVRQALGRMLQAAGISVVAEASEGLGVADLVEDRQPDVLVLDLELPGLHGLDVLHAVVRRSPNTRVLVLSGDCREEVVLGAFRGGASGYLVKGGNVRELVSAVEALAGGGRYASPELADLLVRAALDPSDPFKDPYDTLTDRERAVFRLMAEGKSNPAIGARLEISPRTAETHRAHVMQKLHLRSQTDVVLYGVRRGLIRVEQ